MIRKNRRVSGGYRRSILFKHTNGFRFEQGTATSAVEAHAVDIDKPMTSPEKLCPAQKNDRDE